VHRDFKPANVLFGSTGQPVLVDYGLVKSHGLSTDLPGSLDEQTRPGAICGTPYYMSHQRLEGGQASPQDDVYAFSLALVELLTGRLPRGAGGQSIFALASSRRRGIQVPLLNCPGVVRRLIRFGLSPKRADRPTLEDFEMLLS